MWWLGLVAIAFSALVAVLIWFIVRLAKTLAKLEAFLGATQETLQTTMGEMNENLRSLRNVTDNITIVTEDVKALSGSVRDVGDSVRKIATNVSQIGELVQGLRAEASGTLTGLKAGIKSGFEFFLKSLFPGR